MGKSYLLLVGMLVGNPHLMTTHSVTKVVTSLNECTWDSKFHPSLHPDHMITIILVSLSTHPAAATPSPKIVHPTALASHLAVSPYLPSSLLVNNLGIKLPASFLADMIIGSQPDIVRGPHLIGHWTLLKNSIGHCQDYCLLSDAVTWHCTLQPHYLATEVQLSLSEDYQIIFYLE